MGANNLSRSSTKQRLPSGTDRLHLYHHFVLLLWEERDANDQHLTRRFSLQDSQKEARIGFKNLEELTAFLERWMKSSSDEP